ncbi:unnamed protein product [Merluccius merluccius]
MFQLKPVAVKEVTNTGRVPGGRHSTRRGDAERGVYLSPLSVCVSDLPLQRYQKIMADGYPGSPQPVFLPHHAVRHRGAHGKSITYLAMIACVLQDAPGKMLTFQQLMEKLEEFVTHSSRKCVENNVRMCLSNHKCFVKIPMHLRMPRCLLNRWKLDHSQITAKMVRRHFKEILGQFPELAPKMATDAMTHHRSPGPITTVTHTPEPVCKSPPTRRSKKFSGPFSIESLLRRDSASRRGPKPPPPPPPPPPHRPPLRSCQSVMVKQEAGSPGGRDDGAKGRLSLAYLPVETLLPGSDKRGPFYTTWSNVDIHRVGGLETRPFKRMCVEPSPGSHRDTAWLCMLQDHRATPCPEVTFVCEQCAPKKSDF